MTGLTVRRIADGLWLWQVPDPSRPDGHVTSLYFEAPEHMVLVDPILPGASTANRTRVLKALDDDLRRVARPLVIVATTPAESGDAAFLADRFGAAVYRQPVPGGQEIVPGVGAVPATQNRQGNRIVTIVAQRAVFCGDILQGVGDGVLGWGPHPLHHHERTSVIDRLVDLAPTAVIVSRGESILFGGLEALRSLLRLTGQEFV